MKYARRQFLRRLSHAALTPVLIPIARQLVGTAAAAGNPQRLRFVFYIWNEALHTDKSLRGDGLYNDRELPQAPANFSRAAMGNFLSDFDGCLDKLAVLERFSQTSLTDLHGNKEAVITCRSRNGDGPGGASIDGVLAEHLGQGYLHEHVCLGASARDLHTSHHDSDMFAVGPGQFRFCEGSASAAFERYFGSGGTGAEPVSTFPRRAKLYGYLKEDVQRLRQMLGSEERVQLEGYLDGLDRLEQRLDVSTMPTASCSEVSVSRAAEHPEATARTLEDAQNYMRNYAAHMEVIKYVLACGISPVVAFKANAGPYDFLGAYGRFNDFWHNEKRYGGGIDTVQALQQVQAWQARNIAQLHLALREFPAGEGRTVADDTVIVVVSKSGGSHHNGYHEHPVLLLGDAAGALKTSQYIGFEKETRSLNDLWVSLAQLAGLDLSSFGEYGVRDKKGKGTPRTGVLSEIFA
ncbi:MAG: DUF1552 domain-containing protein [Myxococcota bacterium]